MQQGRDATDPRPRLQTCHLHMLDEGILVLTDIIEIAMLHKLALSVLAFLRKQK